MKLRSKKREKSRIASEETRISLYCVFGNEYRDDTEFTANSLSPASSVTSGCCKYEAAKEVGGRRRRRSPDLKAVDNDRPERFGRGISSAYTGVNFSRESTSTVEISPEVMATEKPELAPPETVSDQRKSPAALAAAKMPSAAELEEFFTEAEEYVQKRFTEKYSYDIVKDAPILGGRYQWVRMHI